MLNMGGVKWQRRSIQQYSNAAIQQYSNKTIQQQYMQYNSTHIAFAFFLT